MTLKSLSLVWISDVNFELRLEKALLVYTYTQDLYLTLGEWTAELPESEIWVSALTSAVCYPHVKVPSSRDCQAHLQGQPRPLCDPFWDSRLQVLFQPPVLPHSFSPPLFKILQQLFEKDAHARDHQVLGQVH